MNSPLSPACARTLILLTATDARPGTSATVGSLIFLAARFLCLTGAVAGALVSVATGAGATSAVGEVTGAGISGSAFVLLSCAIAVAAIIVPKISQQFVFMIPTVKFLFPFLSMSAICPVSIRLV